MSALESQHRLIPAALESVCTACSISRAVQSNLEQLRQVTKDDRSPVTVADYAAQAITTNNPIRMQQAMLQSDFYNDPERAKQLKLVQPTSSIG